MVGWLEWNDGGTERWTGMSPVRCLEMWQTLAGREPNVRWGSDCTHEHTGGGNRAENLLLHHQHHLHYYTYF